MENRKSSKLDLVLIESFRPLPTTLLVAVDPLFLLRIATQVPSGIFYQIDGGVPR